jgi:hypothetical protein
MLVLSVSARADIFLFANLTHDQETNTGPLTTSTGDPRPLSFGTALFDLNDAKTAMKFTATIYNIDITGTQTEDTNDNLRAAHIHASPTAAPNTNAPVVWGFFGAPFNDNNPNDVVVTPFASGVGGTISGKWDLPEGNSTTLDAQLQNILTGHSYINFHTVQFGGGEIRGFPTIVPEPGTLALLAGLGVSGLGLLARRLRRR